LSVFVFFITCLFASGLQKNAFGHVPLRSKIPALKSIHAGKGGEMRATLEKEKTHVALKSFANSEIANALFTVAKSYTSSIA